ncbi:hypothetical protein WA026_002408 [Henosepilachna vigintioctopunctata]|uniref:G-protein coupled receptors family 2 profile 2 domain-containing protein n=1 Tax=Henosepilachna vigintioctopunctata TaxID=420089 RepID=A0AAW1TZL9_9CUCU
MNFNWILPIWYVLQVANCQQAQNCCQGNNTIRSGEKKCVDGSLKDVLPCPNRFIIKADDDVYESRGVLNLGAQSISNDRFCKLRNNTQYVYIVCYEPEDLEEPSTVLTVLGLISALFLFLTIAIYISLPKLLDLQGICIIHSLFGLSITYIILGIHRLNTLLTEFECQIYAYALYFAFLYAFFWLNTYCFHLWRTTTEPKILGDVKSWKIIYYIYSCGSPILLLLLVIFAQVSGLYIYTHPRMAEESICFFGTLEATALYLYGPISVLLSLNIVYFICTVYRMWKEVHQYDGRKLKILKYRLSLCVKMFFVMGMSWIFEVLSGVFEHKYPSIWWNVTDTINALQGVFIFLILVILRKRVYRLMAEKPYGKWLPPTWRSMGNGDEECTEAEEDYKLDQVNSSSS